MVRRQAVGIEVDLVAIREAQVPGLVTGLEREQQQAAVQEGPVEFPNTRGKRAGGVWMIEYQATMPSRVPSANSSASIDPSLNCRLG